MNAAKFRALVESEIKAGRVHETLTCGGDYNVTPEEAIASDWLHALQQTQADVTEHCRFLGGDDEAYHRRALKRDLARLAAIAQVMAANVEELQ